MQREGGRLRKASWLLAALGENKASVTSADVDKSDVPTTQMGLSDMSQGFSSLGWGQANSSSLRELVLGCFLLWLTVSHVFSPHFQRTPRSVASTHVRWLKTSFNSRLRGIGCPLLASSGTLYT